MSIDNQEEAIKAGDTTVETIQANETAVEEIPEIEVPVKTVARWKIVMLFGVCAMFGDIIFIKNQSSVVLTATFFSGCLLGLLYILVSRLLLKKKIS